MSRRPDEARQDDFAILEFAQVPGEADAREQVFQRALMDQLADVLRDEIRVGPRRLVPAVAPGFVCLAGVGVRAEEIERLSGRLVPEALALKVRGDGEDFEAVLDRKSTRLNSSHLRLSRMPSSA